MRTELNEENRINNPFISIAIASYNYGRYLDRAIQAIARQKFKDFEVVYLDDASTDDSVEIINNIIKLYPDIHIRLIQNQVNEGIHKTKTRLIRECCGEYIMLCDADDWMADDCLEVLAGTAKAEGSDRVVCEVTDIDEKGRCLQIQNLPQEPSRWLWNLNHGCLYRRSILIDNDIVIQLEPDDVHLITELNKYTKKVSWVNRPLYYWLVHEDSSGRAVTQEMCEHSLNEFGKMTEYLKTTRSQMASKKDKDEIELLAMKLYYLYLFHTMKNYSLKGKLNQYRRVRKIMRDNFPGYLNAPAISSSKKIIRSYAYSIIRFSVILEKTKLFVPAYIGYHLISKVHYFDQ